LEIITGIERRRRWRDEDKLRILAEIDRPGSKVSEVARRHDVSRGLVWQWRRDLRDGRLHEAGSRHFIPLRVENSLPEQPVGPAAGGRIEITLPDGTCLRVGPDVDAAALRRVLSALRR
jgi:transposase-like protein